MQGVNRIGFTKLSDGEDAGNDPQGSKRVNIVLVHGLRGHPFQTWASNQQAGDERAVGPSSRRQHIRSFFKSTTPPLESNSTQKSAGSRTQQVFWPKEYLAEDVSQARIWTYGYNADVIGGLFQANDKNSVSAHGRDLAVRLEREIDEDPIIFVAHSLGGILVKDAIRRSEACRQRTRFIVFLGTPHRGSTPASWGEIASNLARLALQDSNKKIVETLEVDSEVLDNIHEQFINVVFEHGIRIHSFQEGRGISGITGLDGKVVSDFSSKLGLPKIETIESIDANHMQMARCRDRSDESYRFIAGVLKQFLKNANPDTDSSVRPMMHTQRETSTEAHEVEAPCSTTSYYCLPFLRNRRFTGRTKKLKELEEKLMVRSDYQKLAILGLGGVGKTQVVLELAYTVKERWPAYSIYWVPAVSAESFEQAYRDIATQCSVALNPTEEDPKESVRRYLNSGSAGKWLLIVDNADDQEILFGASGEVGGVTSYLPESENGLTLFTTRYREIAVSLADSEVIEIQEMDHQEAESFLTRSLTQKDLLNDRAIAMELLNELTFLPLAIAQAAAYLNAMQISIREYLSLLRGTEQDTVSLLSREFRDNTRYRNSKNAVAATWLISFDQIRRSDSLAADLLSFMSCIEYKAIPRSILPTVEPEERMVHAIGTLCAYAFVTKRADTDNYDMHRLVHLATKVWLDKQDALQKVKEEATIHLAESFPSEDYTNRATWREYFPHAFQSLRITKELNIKARLDLCTAVGSCLLVDGRVREAVGWLSECYSWWQGYFPEDHPSRLTSQQVLASAYQADGQVSKAVELLEQVVAIPKKVLQEDHPYRLASQQVLASAYQADGQVSKAVELLEQVVVIEEKVLQKDDPYRLSSQHALASAYRADGQVLKAVKLLEQVVAIEERVLQEDHPSRLASQQALAIVYQADGQVLKAVKLLEQVVAIEEKVLKEDHPSRLASQRALASVYQADGQVLKAVKLLEQVVAIEEKVLQEDHPSRLASQHELAIVYRADGQVLKAVKLLEQVVAIRGKVLKEDHPSRLVSQQALLSLYTQQRSQGERQNETSAQYRI